MKKFTVIFGNMTFHHLVEEELKLFKTNNEQKALVHRIDKVMPCDTEAEMNALIDKYENNFESWLAPHEFKGEVVYEPEPKKTIEQAAESFLTQI